MSAWFKDLHEKLKTGMTLLARPPWRLASHGAGASVAVLDSGFSRTHPALREVVIAEARSFTGHDPLFDPVGHGTECCSTLVSLPGHGGVGGVAPDVRLFVGQIFGPHGLGTLETLCMALEWVASLEVDVLAIPSGRMTDHLELRRALDLVFPTGTLIIAPVGNPYNGQKGPLYPAAYPNVMGVGSEAYLETYRTWDRPPDVIMAAHDVPVCTLDGGWRVAADTSQATMLVTGFACLLAAVRRETGVERLTCEAFLASMSKEMGSAR